MRCTAIAVLAVLTAPVLGAQERGFVRGLGGVTLGGAETSMAGGIGGGVRLNKHLDLFAEAGMVRDVMPGEIQDELDSLAILEAAISGVPVELDIEVPNQYGIAGIRVNTPTPAGSLITPFLEIGGGAGRIAMDFDVEVFGLDLTRELREEIGDLDVIKLLLAGGAGIHISATRQLGFDVGYRYHRIFTDDPAISTHLVYVGLLFRF